MPIPNGEADEDEGDEDEGQPLRPLQVVRWVEVPPPARRRGPTPGHRLPPAGALTLIGILETLPTLSLAHSSPPAEHKKGDGSAPIVPILVSKLPEETPSGRRLRGVANHERLKR